MTRKTKWGIVAGFLIFMGFGMIHGGSKHIETAGNLMIGSGCLYLIYLLYTTQKK